MAHRHPLIPAVKISSDKVYKFSDEAEICHSCDLPDGHCSEKCKRYKRELAKLNQVSSSGSNDESDRES